MDEPNAFPESPAHNAGQVKPQITLIERHHIPPWLFALAALFSILFLYQMVGFLVTYLLYGLEPGEENVQGLRVVTALCQLLLILVPTLIFVRFIANRPAEFFRLRLPDVRTFIVPVVGIFSLQQMLQVYMVFQSRIPLPAELEKLVHEMKELIEKVTAMLAGSSSLPELLWVTVVVALVPAFCEEFLFRGLAQRSFERHMNPMAAAVVTGVLFGAYHLNPFAFVPLVILGIYLGFLAMRAGSLWVSIAAHFYNNAYACLSFYLRMDDDVVGIGDPEKFSYGTLLLLFWAFGVVFLVSTLYFVRITAPVEESTAPEME